MLSSMARLFLEPADSYFLRTAPSCIRWWAWNVWRMRVLWCPLSERSRRDEGPRERKGPSRPSRVESKEDEKKLTRMM